MIKTNMKYGGNMARNELFERRKYRRIKVDMELKFHEIITDSFFNEKGGPGCSRIIDISRGGMQILTENAWNEGGDKLIEAEFNIAGKPIRLIAHVVWSMYDDKLKMYRSGAEFIVVKSGDLDVIAEMA